MVIKIADEHLCPIDRLRIRWLCSSWRSTTAKNPPAPFTFQPPLLLLLRRTPSGMELGFFSLLRRNFIDLTLPASLRGHRCCGSSDGWLIMVSDSALQLSLFHPMSQTQLSLPSEPQCILGTKHHPPLCRLKKAVLSAAPTDRNCIVAAIVGFNVILLCRPGQTLWTVFQGAVHCDFEDIVFHKGRLYAFASTGKLTVITLDSRLRGTVTSEVQPKPEMTIRWLDKGRYLVETGDDIFLVVKEYTSPDMTFLVFKLEGDNWIPWQCTDEWCLFVGSVRSELIPAQVVGGVKANCVHFTSKLGEKVAPDGLGIYYFEGDKVEPIAIPREAGCCSLFEPVWVKPTLYL